MPMQVIDGAKLSNMERLAVLQHQGAATGFLDFTEFPFVALWFACRELSDKDARVFVLDIGDHRGALNSRTLEEERKDPFEPRQTVVYYEPGRSLGPRIVAQRSVFVICAPRVPDQYVKAVHVPRESKEELRRYLTRLGLSSTVLFGDIPGLAEANSTRTPLPRSTSTPEQHRHRGSRAYQTGRYEDALAAYDSYAASRPDVAEPHGLRGDALAAVGRFEDAERAYTSAIENQDHLVDLGDNTVVEPEPIRTMMMSRTYYNRGNVRAALGDHRGAVLDFDVAVRSGYEPKRDVLKNRGNSRLSLELFPDSHQDFEEAWFEEAGSDAALAMGNCKMMEGALEEALERYVRGSAHHPEGTAAHCRNNASQLSQLMEVINDCVFLARREDNIILIEISCADIMPANFPFAGNQGNTGNTSSGILAGARGGKGYEGSKGFVVSIDVSPQA